MEQRFPTWTWPSNLWQPHTARRFFEQLSLDIQSVHAPLSWNRDFCLGHAILILDSRIQLEDSSTNSSSTVKVFTRLFLQTRAMERVPLRTLQLRNIAFRNLNLGLAWPPRPHKKKQVYAIAWLEDSEFWLAPCLDGWRWAREVAKTTNPWKLHSLVEGFVFVVLVGSPWPQFHQR